MQQTEVLYATNENQVEFQESEQSLLQTPLITPLLPVQRGGGTDADNSGALRSNYHQQ